MVQLRVFLVGLALLAICLGWWTWLSTRDRSPDGREPLVFWAPSSLGEDIYTVIDRFERANPRYKVVLGNATARDPTGDGQRLLSAIAGGVPPDLVWFDRFAIGEWAARGAFADLSPYLAQQRLDDPYRLDLAQYYPWAVDEASYAKPGSGEAPRLFGIPTSVDIRALYLNNDLLRREGLVDAAGEPKPPATWEELRSYGLKLSRFRDAGRPASGLTRLGFAPNYGNSWLYIYAWQAGGELLNPDRTRITLDSDPVVRALRFMTDVYDDLGGAEGVNAFQSGFQGGAFDPFIRGDVAMKIDGDWSLQGIAEWKPEMDFSLVPAPLPADRIAAGHQPITWAGGWSLVIPTTAKRKDAAFRLIQYLRSDESVRLLEQGNRERKQSEGRLFLPRGDANRVFYERSIAETVDANPAMPPAFKRAFATLRDLMPRTLIRPVTPVGQMLWNQHIRAYDDGVNHTFAAAAAASGQDEMRLALASKQGDVQRQLDAVLGPPPPQRVDWGVYLGGYVALLLAAVAAIWIAVLRRPRRWRPRAAGAAMLFVAPWAIGFAALVGGPIVFSIVFSFTSYDVLHEARYVGLANYRELFADPVFFTALGNTAYMILRIPLVMAAGLAIALLLNHAIRGLAFYRTALYLPAVMPLVAASLLWIGLFNASFGVINQVLDWMFTTAPAHAVEWVIQACGAPDFHLTAPKWLDSTAWSKPALVLMSIWSAGGGMVIWLAGLQSIPQHLYEAASIDGAKAWQRFRHITWPMLSPYILFNFVVGLIGTMQIFGEAFIMTAGGPADSTLFYAYYLFKQAFQFFRMGYASALAWILFLIVLALTMVQLWVSKKWVHYDQA